jgi:hypothetical protein
MRKLERGEAASSSTVKSPLVQSHLNASVGTPAVRTAALGTQAISCCNALFITQTTDDG